MKTTLSIIQVDTGNIGGHFKPSKRFIQGVKGYAEFNYQILSCMAILSVMQAKFPNAELEHGGTEEKMKKLDPKFTVRG